MTTSRIPRDIIADALVLYKCSDNPDSAAQRILSALQDAGYTLQKQPPAATIINVIQQNGATYG